MNNPQSQNTGFDLFNIFRESVIYNENAHSDVIAYFLGRKYPKSNHRFPQYTNFLSALLSKFTGDLPISIDLMDLANATVYREFSVTNDQSKGRIDILVKIPLLDGNNFVLVIENKITRFEHGDQLSIYHEHITNNNEVYQKSIFIFLTPSGIDASNGNYKSLSYRSLAGILQNISSEDENIQAFMTLYSFSLKQISEHIPTNLQDYLAVIIKLRLKDFEEHVKVVDSYSNTWVDFEPHGWDAIISSLWKGGRPANGIWGFSFWLGQNGLSLELYFLHDEQLEPFYKRVCKIGQKDLVCIHEPKRIGEGDSKWMSIYSRKILSPQDFREKGKLYSQSKSQDILAAVERRIISEWLSCLEELETIKGILQQSQ